MMVDLSKIKAVAMDLDGTITQHKEPLTEKNREALVALSEKYRLVIVGAGQVMRIFNQIGHFPIDIIGNYGLQYGTCSVESGAMEIKRDLSFQCDRESVDRRITDLRQRFGLTIFRGDSVEYHPSGCITFPLLGTKALQTDKLAYDPDRKKRRAIYQTVCDAFPEYNVFIGGSSSFDMSPIPYNKYYALLSFCAMFNLRRESVVYIGDDYGLGGNDESVYLSNFPFLTIDNYRDFPEVVKCLL